MSVSRSVGRFGWYVCRVQKMHRRNYVAQTRAYSKSDLVGKNPPMTPVLFILLYARAALARTKKKRSPRNGKLKANRASETEEQRKEMLRIGAKKIGQQG